MAATNRQDHWNAVYETRGENEVSWFEESPAVSLDLIRATGVKPGASIVDIGGGASRLVDALLKEQFAITILDLSKNALATAATRLGTQASKVTWLVADVTTWHPPQAFDVWHDRATFHFLTEADDRAAYAARATEALRPGGHIIIGTFALDGPEQCSGLPVVRHDAISIGQILGRSFELIETRNYDHQTPKGGIQKFQFSRFQRSLDK